MHKALKSPSFCKRVMEKEKLVEAVHCFDGKKIAVVGDVMLDKYVYGTVDRINAENPEVSLLRIKSKEFRLGGAANVALNLSCLGVKVSLFGVLGDDLNGVLFKKLCKESDINLVSFSDGETIVKERFVDPESKRYFLRSDYGEAKLSPINEEGMCFVYESLKKTNPDAIILSDYNKKIFRGDFGKRLIELAHEREIPIIVDPKPENIESFKNSTLICPNIREAKKMIGSDALDSTSGDVIVRKLIEMYGTKKVIVTWDDRGMVCHGSGFHEVPSKARKVVDPTGAGDTVCAVITLGLLSGLDFISSTHLATYAAGIVVEKIGTATLSRAELIDRIESDFSEDEKL